MVQLTWDPPSRTVPGAGAQIFDRSLFCLSRAGSLGTRGTGGRTRKPAGNGEGQSVAVVCSEGQCFRFRVQGSRFRVQVQVQGSGC